MKQTTYHCNICGEREESTSDKILAIEFDDENQIVEVNMGATDIHICGFCAGAIRKFCEKTQIVQKD